MRAKVLSPRCRAHYRACIVSLHVQANLPSLLALPYYGWIANTDPLYIATRKAVLSSQNPWWFK
jgi:meiotically up-regulated gene 157 (Mug157) protein